MSAPFFYNGDPVLANYFDPPLVPNKDLHDTILDLEPITSIALNAHKRIQASIIIQFVIRLMCVIIHTIF
mgnify:CR=1 FL=1